MKTSHLELRPVFVRKQMNTQGHVFVVMLALLVQRELENAIANMDITVQEAIEELAAIRMEEVEIGAALVQNIPNPTETGAEILKNAAITMPDAFPKTTPKVATKKNSIWHENRNNFDILHLFRRMVL